MEDMYDASQDIKKHTTENTDNTDEDIPEQRYISAVGKLFRGYTYVNISAVLFTAILTIDFLTTGASPTVFAPVTTLTEQFIPTITELPPTSPATLIFDSITILTAALGTLGLNHLRNGKNTAKGLTLSKDRLIGNDEQEQERIIRQIGYIHYGTTLIPAAILVTVGLTASVLFAVSQLGII